MTPASLEIPKRPTPAKLWVNRRLISDDVCAAEIRMFLSYALAIGLDSAPKGFDHDLVNNVLATECFSESAAAIAANGGLVRRKAGGMSVGR